MMPTEQIPTAIQPPIGHMMVLIEFERKIIQTCWKPATFLKAEHKSRTTLERGWEKSE